MTDISVIKMITWVAAWRIYPSWVNDKLRGVGGTRPLRNVLGETLAGRFSFEGRNYLFSFPSYVNFEEFFVSRAFVKFGAKHSSAGAFGFDDVFELFWNPLGHRASFCEVRLRPEVFFENFHSNQSRCYLPDSCDESQAEQSSSVMVRRKLETSLPGIGESECRGGPSIIVAISTSRLQWSMVQKRQKPDEVSVWLPFIVCKTSEATSKFWGACFRDPMFLPFCTQSLFSYT